jgi:alkylation response protein AidB-like acyl-CoA dehydrogenase
MRIAYTDAQAQLRDTLRAYFAELVTPEVDEEMSHGEFGGPRCREAVRRMGHDGWLGVGWPKEYGGQGFTPVEQFVFFDEAQRTGAPVPFLTVNAIGPAIMRFGTEEQKADLLPRILRGECMFAIGYSEPGAGTDLASLKTRAILEPDGSHYIVNGQKIFTSLTDHADYVWLACRTDPGAPERTGKKHKGISILVVPTDSPGFSYTPIHTIGEASTFATYYEDVRVPAGNVIGEPGEGWRVITTQLNYERVALCSSGSLERPFNDVVAWARETRLADGSRVVDREWVRVHLARVQAKLAALRLFNWKVAAADQAGKLNPADASATKVWGTELYCEAYGLMLEVLGAAGALKKESPGALLAGRIERAYRGVLILTFGGGTNEIQRDLIAVFGLGLPRSFR